MEVQEKDLTQAAFLFFPFSFPSEAIWVNQIPLSNQTGFRPANRVIVLGMLSPDWLSVTPSNFSMADRWDAEKKSFPSLTEVMEVDL